MKTLRMSFSRADDSKKSLSLNYAKDGLTEPQVRTVMQAIIDNELLVPAVLAIEGAEIIDRTVTDII